MEHEHRRRPRLANFSLEGPAVKGSSGAEARPEGRSAATHDRVDVTWAVDCVADDTFLYASIANISEMGIFVRRPSRSRSARAQPRRSRRPVTSRSSSTGEVAWINPVRASGDNPNPGMGIRFVDLTPANRERLVEVVRTIAYVREPS